MVQVSMYVCMYVCMYHSIFSVSEDLTTPYTLLLVFTAEFEVVPTQYETKTLGQLLQFIQYSFLPCKPLHTPLHMVCKAVAYFVNYLANIMPYSILDSLLKANL